MKNISTNQVFIQESNLKHSVKIEPTSKSSPPPKNKKNKKKRNSLSCSTSFFNYAKRITVNSPTDQLADANSPTYKIE